VPPRQSSAIPLLLRPRSPRHRILSRFVGWVESSRPTINAGGSRRLDPPYGIREKETRIMRRPGITLLEVLSAIFIAGIGLLSLLTLFPLGALKMLESVNDDRAAQAGGNAKAIANAVVMRLDADVQTAMLNQAVPGAAIAPPFPAAGTPTQDGPGYPVLVDPIGNLAYAGVPGWQSWVANLQPTAAVPVQGVP